MLPGGRRSRRGKSGSQQTLRWREVDSNPRSPVYGEPCPVRCRYREGRWESGSQQTPHWREMDSNLRFPDRWSRPSSWWRFETEFEARDGCGSLGGKSSAVGAPQGSAIDGMADCAAAGAPLSSPAPLAHRCAAAGLDSGSAAERSRDGLRVSQPGTERSNLFPSQRRVGSELDSDGGASLFGRHPRSAHSQRHRTDLSGQETHWDR